MTQDNEPVRIVCFDKKSTNKWETYQVVALVEINGRECLIICGENGLCWDCEDDCNRSLHIELPEEQKHDFKVGDIIKIHLAEDRYDNWIAIVAYVHGDLIGVTINNQLFVYDSKCIELVESNKEQCEFKPFDKVIVWNEANKYWLPTFYAQERDGYYETIDGKLWLKCIPYEGNEHLVGTTNNPK